MGLLAPHESAHTCAAPVRCIFEANWGDIKLEFFTAKR
jgi:hypothetical protein